MTAKAINACFQVNYGSFQLDADLALPGTGITALYGPSGSGKTTLLRCMAGLQKPRQGFFSINGNVWQDSEKNLFLPTYQRSLGYVFQEANLFPHLSVADNLQFGLKRTARQQGNGVNLNAVIELFGIGQLLDRMPERLSGGERQRVAIARALVLNPAILLMDEPLASLDLKRKQEVMPFLLKLQQEFDIPIVYVTHSRQEVMQLADTLVMLDQGRVQAIGALSDMLSRLDLPLAQEKNAACVWRGTITGHDAEFQLSSVQFAGVTLSLPHIDSPAQNKLRVQIQARDVSITLQEPRLTSILNVLPATITGLADDQSGHTTVKLQCGQETLIAHITRKSSQILELRAGMPVFAQIKGTSLLGGGSNL